MLIRVTNLMSLIDSCFATMIQYQSQEADNTFRWYITVQLYAEVGSEAPLSGG